MANENRDWKISGIATSPKFGYCHPLPSILTLLVINSSEFELKDKYFSLDENKNIAIAGACRPPVKMAPKTVIRPFLLLP